MSAILRCEAKGGGDAYMIPTSNKAIMCGHTPSCTCCTFFHFDEKDLISEGWSLSLTSSGFIGELKAA